MTIWGIIFAAFMAWMLVGEDLVRYGMRAINERREHKERMAALAAQQEQARTKAIAKLEGVRREDVPPELVEAWREVNEITTN